MVNNFKGLMKPGNYGTEIIDGIEYTIIYKPWQSKLKTVIKFIQFRLWKIGVAVYDPIFGECTPDFNCCCDCGRKAFIKIHWRSNNA